MKKALITFIFSLSIFACFGENIVLQEDFENPKTKLNIIGRGDVRIENGVLKTKDAYAVFGDSTLRNYRATFRARASTSLSQWSVSEVEPQIWVGFRHANRFDRYVVGLRGGLQNDIQVFRLGYMGADELLDIQPILKRQRGEWYQFVIEVYDSIIHIFVANNGLIVADIKDKNYHLAPNGGVTLGGGWIENEFDDLKIETINADDISNSEDFALETDLDDSYWETDELTKELNRLQQIRDYQPKKINKLPKGRQEFSLNGDWQFAPNPEKDTVFHIMQVPNFWNPSRIWLHGETMNDGKFPKGVSDVYYRKESDRCEAYTFDYRNTKSALYQQYIDLPKGIENKVSELVFDAVSKMAEVYVNGAKVASHVGMFGEIRVDVSRNLHAGRNRIDVLVKNETSDNTQPDYYKIARIGEGSNSSDNLQVTNDVLKDIAHGFYQGNPAGIWQPVRLIISDKIKVEDVFIKPSLTGATFEVTIKNHSNKKTKFKLQTVISPHHTAAGEYNPPLGKVPLEGDLGGLETKTFTYSINDLQPKLWSPTEPNLYDFNFIIDKDIFTVVSGFRTFESKNGLLYLNGKPYWLRGGNHTPFALAPNDTALADTFYLLMKAANMQITRTHTTPYNKLWIDKADEIGIGISHEGTYPWLMIHGTMPDSTAITLWADEYIALLKKYRNHPSILFWTINNEMKFYDNEPDMQRRIAKMHIIERVVKRMREADPTRPICFDSNYRRREDIFGKEFYGSTSLTDRKFDDGDIDDIHAYTNWYDHTIFKQFNGEFQRDNRNEGRPLISQEMSTGYPDTEDGHATRFYTLVHQNPQTLIGNQAYAFGNPDYFLKTQAFITGELAEALRRTNDKASGILHFALLTWFQNVYDAQNIKPYPTYYAMKRAMQPVLVSAELWGRHFYAGEKIPAQIYIVNDKENGEDLAASVLEWRIEGLDSSILANGTDNIPAVKYYGRYHFSPEINIPANIQGKVKAKLLLRLYEDGNLISVNEYEILIAGKDWVQNPTNKRIVVYDTKDEITAALDFFNVKYTKVKNLENALKAKADILILDKLSKENALVVRNYIAGGGKVLILNEETARAVFPEYITGWITPTEGDIVNMEVPESPIFNDIDLMDLRYFNNNKREIPTVCRAAYQINRSPNVQPLASQTKIHGYIDVSAALNDQMQQRRDYMKTIKGFPLLEIKEGKGSAIISSMSLEKAVTDPIAGRLLINMIESLSK
ncbi:MAG: glycoside hydrolase family 2 [Prevotellaceae bacterium]|jgi:hypothetical protein|nr:glycoside hydrolase family 2 [Prevotellaceae bacterium]